MYLGIDGFINGWCCCSLNHKMIIHVIPNIKSIITFEKCNKILIDIPIGLTGYKIERKLDGQLRKFIPKGRKSSVFNTPSRPSVYSNTYAEAKQKELSILGKSISIQSWNIVNKIKEVDQFLCENPSFNNQIQESHPELCFYYLNNETPLFHSKKTLEGLNERVEIINQYYKNSNEILDMTFIKNKKMVLKKMILLMQWHYQLVLSTGF